MNSSQEKDLVDHIAEAARDALEFVEGRNE